ncbi:MAG: hypothetical protein R3C49_23980 [Planctomycetaceae bacterium]
MSDFNPYEAPATDASGGFESSAEFSDGKHSGRLPSWLVRIVQLIRRGFRTIAMFCICVPGLWLIAVLVSANHPGDEYGLIGVASLPAWWIAPLIWLLGMNVIRQKLLAIVLISVAGCTALFAVGWAMDRLKVSARFWALTVLAFFAWTLWLSLSQYPTYARAIAKNGSIHAYWSASLAVSVYTMSVACLAVTGVWRLAVRIFR